MDLRSIFAFVELSVIIVNYNAKYFAEQCLLSVIKACKGIDAEIFMVDNNSTDGSREYLEPRFSSVHFIWNKANTGFGKANNSVLPKARGEYILFLNPDTIVPEDCFSACISFFKKHFDCGALGVRMIDGSGIFLPESKRNLPSPASGFYKMFGSGRGYYADHLPETATGKVEVLAGAFMMLNKTAVEKTTGFDEAFFMYGEDIDLSYRITKAGMNNYYAGEITIIHFKGESTGKGLPEYTEHFYGAMKLFTKKHYSGSLIKSIIIKAGIDTSKLISKIKRTKKTSLNAGKSKGTVKATLAGNEATMISAEKILKGSAEYTIAERIYDPENIIEAITKKNIGAVVFCGNGFSNKKIISLLQQLPHYCLAFFYQQGSGAIISSADKNSNGFFITAKEQHR